MKRWCSLLIMFDALQVLVGLALVPVGWWAIVSDHYVAWDRLGVAFRDGAIDSYTYPQFASANAIYDGGESDIGRDAPSSGNRSAEQMLIWIHRGSQKLPPLAISLPWLLAGCGVVTLLLGWQIQRVAFRAGIAS